jgi:hypothetical protein
VELGLAEMLEELERRTQIAQSLVRESRSMAAVKRETREINRLAGRLELAAREQDDTTLGEAC